MQNGEKAPRIKVCGVTRPEQAEQMENMGVELLGLNFVPGSKRLVSDAQAAEIRSAISPRCALVGVFQNQSASFVADTAERFELDSVQLHGDESPDTCLNTSYPVIKAFSFENRFDKAALEDYEVDFFLFDARAGDQLGGTGKSFDWNSLQRIKISRPWILAGGLGADNLEKALNILQPWAVDLNSRIETSPGVKDLKTLKRCIEIRNEFRARFRSRPS